MDELAARRAKQSSEEAATAALAERAYARYVKPLDDADRAINFAGGEFANYALENGFLDKRGFCAVHASTEAVNQLLGIAQMAFFAGVLAERERSGA